MPFQGLNTHKMFTTCRAQPQFDARSPYLGSTVEISLSYANDDEKQNIIYNLYGSVLWYLQFYDVMTPSDISQYFGIIDIDVPRPENTTDEDYTQLKREYLPTLVNLLNNDGYTKYKIYWSGTKGYHVYLFDDKFWRKPSKILNKAERNIWIQEQLEILYPSLLKEIDYSIYHINKGIRAFTWPHPKTKLLNTLMINNTSEMCFWSWMLEMFKSSAPLITDLKSTVLNYNGTRPGGNTITSISTNNDLLDEIKLIYNNAPITVNNRMVLISSKYCPIKKGDHKEKGKNYIILSDDNAIIRCHSDKCRNEIILKKKFTPLTNFYSLLNDMLDQNLIRTLPSRLRIIPPDQKYVLEDDIEWSIGDGYGIISAPMSAGKTTSVASFLQKKPKKFKVLLLVVRITQAHNFTTKYPGMKSYLEADGSVYSKNSVVLCINSLQRVLDVDGTIPVYDLLILDEIEALIEGLVGTILSTGRGKQCDIWKLFQILIKSSKSTLFMDGILTKRTARFLHGMNILQHCRVVQHHGQPDYRIYISHLSNSTFEKDFMKDMGENKKIVVVSNSKEALYLFESKTGGALKDTLVITGDSSKKDKLTASDPNSEWKKDILAFNTAVGPGASFDAIHYDIMYCICSPSSCTPYSLYQLINRIRVIKSKTVKLFILHKEQKNFPTIEELKNKKAENIVEMHQKQNIYYPRLSLYNTASSELYKLAINEVDHTVMKELIAKKQLVMHYEDSFFIDTLVECEHEKFYFDDTNNYCKTLFDIIRRNGGMVQGDMNVDNKNSKYEKKSTFFFKKEAKANYKSRGGTVDCFLVRDKNSIDPISIITMNKYVTLNDVATHLRWSGLRRALTRSEETLYEKELSSINQRKKAISNCLIYSVKLLESFKEICDSLGFRIETARGIVEGNNSYDCFLNKHAYYQREAKTIFDQVFPSTKEVYSINNIDTIPSLGRRNQECYKNIQTVFSIFGLNLNREASKVRLSDPDKNRYYNHTFYVCETSQHIRLALSGLGFDNGLPETDAIKYMLDKKIIN